MKRLIALSVLIISVVMLSSAAEAQFVGRTFGVRRLIVDAGDGLTSNFIYLINRSASLGIDNTGLTTPAFPNSCALLDLNSTTKGFLPPRMTNAQMLLMCGGTPPEGLMIANTTKHSLDFYNGSGWTEPWMTKGNFGSDPTVDYIGTNELTDFVVRTNLTERLRVLGAGNVAIGSTTATNTRVQITETGAQTGLNVTSTGIGTGVNITTAGTNNLLVVNGTANATVANVAADAVWDSRINGDQLVTGIQKIGGSIWLDGTSATHQIVTDAPVNIGTKNSNTASLITNGVSRLSVNGSGATTMAGTSFGATYPSGLSFTSAGTSNGNFTASFINPGNGNGISIQVGNGTPANGNNLIEFRNSGGSVIGRVEGETLAELHATPEWIEAIRTFDANITIASLNTAVSTAQTAVGAISVAVGLALAADAADPLCDIACPGSVVAGGLEIGVDIAQAALDGAQTALNAAQTAEANTEKTNYINNLESQLGVTYQSGAGDYAEFMPKNDMTETFTPGNIVAVKGGSITKNTDGATQLMVISRQPIVLGNTPPVGNDAEYEKVAFMGQVPVVVMGRVNRGDYILPSGGNNGLGIAIAPNKMTPSDYKKIVGVAWSASNNESVNQINVAVGINTLAAGTELERQAEEIRSLKAQVNETNGILAKLVPGFKEALGSPISESMPNGKTLTHVARKELPQNQKAEYSMKIADLTKTFGQNIPAKSSFYSRELVEQEFTNVHKKLADAGVDLSKNPFFVQFDSNPAFREAAITTLVNKLNRAIDRQEELKVAKHQENQK
jgi:hypothetical protein